MVIEGQAVAEVDGAEHALAPNDTTRIPAGVPHRFRTLGHRAHAHPLTYASIDAPAR